VTAPRPPTPVDPASDELDPGIPTGNDANVQLSAGLLAGVFTVSDVELAGTVAHADGIAHVEAALVRTDRSPVYWNGVNWQQRSGLFVVPVAEPGAAQTDFSTEMVLPRGTYQLTTWGRRVGGAGDAMFDRVVFEVDPEGEMSDAERSVLDAQSSPDPNPFVRNGEGVEFPKVRIASPVHGALVSGEITMKLTAEYERPIERIAWSIADLESDRYFDVEANTWSREPALREVEWPADGIVETSISSALLGEGRYRIDVQAFGDDGVERKRFNDITVGVAPS